MSDIKCPYCKQEQEVCHDDGFGYEEDVLHEIECCRCEKRFIFTTSISYYYSSQRADCLNGSPHKFSPTHTFPKAFTRMDCEWCGTSRELTEDERIELKIPTKKSYMDSLKGGEA